MHIYIVETVEGHKAKCHQELSSMFIVILFGIFQQFQK